MYKCMTKDIPLSSFASDIFLPLAWAVMLKCDSSDYEAIVTLKLILEVSQARPLLLSEVTQVSTGSTVRTRTDGQGPSTHLMLLRQY